MKKGLDLLNERKWQLAIKLLDYLQQEYQQQNSKIEELLFLKSIALQELNYIQEANEIINQVLKIQPKIYDNLFSVYQKCDDQIGSVIQCYYYKQKGNLNKILEVCNKLGQLDQFYPPILNFKAQTLCELNRLNESKQAYDILISQFPNSFNGYFGKGLLCEKLERYEESLFCYEKASQISPLHKQSYFNKCRILKRFQRYHEQIFVYDLLFQIDKSDSQVYFEKGQIISILGKALLKIENYETAIFYFNLLIKKQDYNNEALIKKSQALIGLEKYAEALEILNNIIHQNPQHTAAQYQMSWLLFKKKNYTQALQFCNQALTMNNSSYKANLLKAKLQLEVIRKNCYENNKEMKNQEEAFRQTGFLIQKWPQKFESYLIRCNIKHMPDKLFMSQNLIFEAMQELNEADVFFPNNLQILKKKTNLLKRIQYYDEALECCDQIIALYPKQGIGYQIKGQILNSLRNYDEAIIYSGKSIILSNINVKILLDRGNHLNNVYRYDEAIEYYNKALHLSPNNILVLYFKSRTLRHQNRISDSYDILQKLIEMNPLDHKFYVDQIQNLHLMGRFEEALYLQELSFDIALSNKIKPSQDQDLEQYE